MNNDRRTGRTREGEGDQKERQGVRETKNGSSNGGMRDGWRRETIKQITTTKGSRVRRVTLIPSQRTVTNWRTPRARKKGKK